MTAKTLPEAWDNYFLLSIQRRGASAQSVIEFAAIIDPTTWAVSAEKPAESVVNAAGGRIYKQDPDGDLEITFDVLPIELSAATGVGLFQEYMELSGTDDPVAYVTSEPLSTDISFPAGVVRTRDRFRIATLWTNDTAASTAAGSTAAGTSSLRFYANNALFVNFEPNMRDGQLKSTVTFKCKPFNKAGTTKNFGWQSGDKTALVTTGPLASYTTSGFPD